MTGPGKRDDELAAAVAAGIRAVTVESPGELARLEPIAARAGRVQPVLLRAAVSEHARLERVRLVGDDGAGKFGMDAADLSDSARRAGASPHLELLGLHAFGASNVLDAGALVAHVAATVRAARRLALAAGTTLRLVDAGGGLGIPYEPHEESLDLVRLGAGLAEITSELGRRPVLSDARLLLEPGRFLVGPAGAYLARVVDRKTVDGSIVVILDGGVHHVLRPALVGQEHRIRAFGGRGRRRDRRKHRDGRMVPVTVAGALCSGLDVFSQAAVMTPPEVGDLVAVLDVGAYGFTESMPLFLSHPIPAEVALRGGRAALIRPRQDPPSGSIARSCRPGTSGSRFFTVRGTASPHAARYGGDDRPDMGRAARRNAAPMHPAATDDLPLLAERLRLGLPLRGFDGREIPLRTAAGECLDATEAAHALLLSGASLLSADYADAYVFAALARAGEIEAAACLAGDPPTVIAAKVTAVLVSAAVRATVIARGPDVSPSAINRATLSWYEMSHLRRRELLDGGFAGQDQRRSA